MPIRRSVLLGLIGAGIGPSLSPPLHEAEAAELGLHCVYRLLDIDEPGRGLEATPRLLTAAREVGFDGVNVTHPCKRIVIDYLDELSEDASRIGAVNTVVLAAGRAVGHNTDGIGFARSFQRNLPDVERRRVVLLGAGGAGAAVAHALLGSGVEELAVVDTDETRATAVVATLRRWSSARVAAHAPAALPSLLETADGLVHATPTGMSKHPGLPLPAELLRPAIWVADIVYRPLETELLRHARAAGCRVLDGGGMVVFQAAEAFHLFTGEEPDPDRMMEHFVKLTDAEAAAADRLGSA
jgi:shikimate dehydrogenase